MADVGRDQATNLREMVDARRSNSSLKPGGDARFIAVSGGKGGVGKSNISLNLAIALGRRGQKVVLMDTDFELPNLDLLVGCVPEWSVEDVMAGSCSPLEALHRIAPNVRLLAGGGVLSGRPDDRQQIRRLLTTLSRQLRKTDYFIIDTRAGSSATVTSFLLAAEMVVMVVVPEPTSVMDAYRTMKRVAREDTESDIALLVNRADRKEARKTYGTVDKMLGHFLKAEVRFAGWLPDDPAVGEAVKRQVPFIEYRPGCRAARGIEKLVDDIAGGGKSDAGNSARGFLGRLAGYLTRTISKGASRNA